MRFVSRVSAASALLCAALTATTFAAVTGTVFADVTPAHPNVAWIEDLYARAIVTGCLTNPLRYCPGNATNRQQMAVFLQKTFNLP